MNYERYDLVCGFEGEVPQEVLHAALEGYRNIELLPPWKKAIVLVAKPNYKIHVFDGDAKESQRFLGTYRYTGLVDEQELQALYDNPHLVVEFCGEFSCQPASTGSLGLYSRRLKGRTKPHMSDAAFILLTEGKQEGDFQAAWSGGSENVGRDGGEPVYRVTEATPEMLSLPVAESTEEVLEVLLQLSDQELQRVNGDHIHDVAEFRDFLRQKLNKLRSR